MDELHQGVDVSAHSAALEGISIRLASLEEAKMEHTLFNSRITELERNVDIISERTKHYEDNFERLNKGFELLSEKLDLLKERVPAREEWNSIKTAANQPMVEEASKWKRIKDVLLTVVLTGGAMFFLNQLLPLFFKKAP